MVLKAHIIHEDTDLHDEICDLVNYELFEFDFDVLSKDFMDFVPDIYTDFDGVTVECRCTTERTLEKAYKFFTDNISKKLPVGSIMLIISTNEKMPPHTKFGMYKVVDEGKVEGNDVVINLNDIKEALKEKASKNKKKLAPAALNSLSNEIDLFLFNAFPEDIIPHNVDEYENAQELIKSIMDKLVDVCVENPSEVIKFGLEGFLMIIRDEKIREMEEDDEWW